MTVEIADRFRSAQTAFEVPIPSAKRNNPNEKSDDREIGAVNIKILRKNDTKKALNVR